MAAAFHHLPDNLLIDILSRASDISKEQGQQQQRAQQQPLIVSTRQQQRYLCGIFTRVSHSLRLAALSICTGLHVCVGNRESIKQLSSWLRRNGGQLQHLSLTISTTSPWPILSILSNSTPQLQSLRLRGLHESTGPMKDEEAAGLGALTMLTSLDVDNLRSIAPALHHLSAVVELSVANVGVGSSFALLPPALPQLQVLRVIPRSPVPTTCHRGYLDYLASMQQLSEVDGLVVEPDDLDHVLFAGACHPSVHIRIDPRANNMGLVEGWISSGGGRRVVELSILNPSWGSPKPLLPRAGALELLQGLDLCNVDLGPGLQQLMELTQLTKLQMMGCSPDVLSLDQLPPSLCSLSLDNLRCLPLAEGQQQQQQLNSAASPCLQHLTSLTLMGEKIPPAAVESLSTLVHLQQLELGYAVSSSLSALGALPFLTALSIPMGGFSFPSSSQVANALRGLSGLQSLHIYHCPYPLEELKLLKEIEHVKVIHFGPKVDSFGNKVEWRRPWQVSMVY